MVSPKVNSKTIRKGDIFRFTHADYIPDAIVITDIRDGMIFFKTTETERSSGRVWSNSFEEFDDNTSIMQFISMVPRTNFIRRLGVRYGRSQSKNY